MKRKITITALCTVAALCLAVAIDWALDNRVSNIEGTADIFVRPDTGVDEVLGQIESGVHVIRPGRLERTFARKKVAEYLKPGHYVVRDGQTSVYIARMLNNGWQTPVRLVLSGNLRVRGNIASKIASQMMADSAEVRRALDDAGFLSAYGVTPQTVFSLFVPDTYEMYWNASVADIFAVQKAAYDAMWTPEREAKAEKAGLTRLQVSTLASIVRGESLYEPELPKIAGVYLNRLRRGMKLQADPTVAFCYDYAVMRILKSHLSIDSPYNTYMYAGLPPGPICIPPVKYIDAVLDADCAGGNLYFCANSDFSGSHLFEKSYSRHCANARAFQRELTRRQAAGNKSDKQ